MALGKLWTIAYRDLGRNRRRSFFSLIAVALGLGLLILMNGYLAGMTEETIQNSIRLQTGHVQVRAASYEEEKLPLKWEDLIADPEIIAANAAALPQVKAAAPVLWATGILNTREDSVGLRLYGIQPDSALYAPIRDGLVSGDFPAPDDRGGILIGRNLADDLGLAVGQNVSLAVVNADSQPDEAVFAVRGIFSSGVPGYDENSVLMPLARAQALTRTEKHASAIVMLLNRQEDAPLVAAQLQQPGLTSLTWREMNQVFLQLMDTSLGFYYVMDAIVMLVVAVVIANTLLMAVFERIREMGILAALGMKSRQIMLMFLLEAATLGIAGIVVGIVLGSAGVGYLATAGIYLGEEIASAAGNIPVSSTIHGRFVPGMFAWLSFWTLVIILLASLYPAWFAARREPVDALRAL
jgi:ABC-type lipoprotein release transport system permease subunit